MNTSNTFLLFEETDHLDEKPRAKVFVSIAEVLSSGTRDDFGDDMESDGSLYFHKGQEKYEKIP